MENTDNIPLETIEDEKTIYFQDRCRKSKNIIKQEKRVLEFIVRNNVDTIEDIRLSNLRSHIWNAEHIYITNIQLNQLLKDKQIKEVVNSNELN